MDNTSYYLHNLYKDTQLEVFFISWIGSLFFTITLFYCIEKIKLKISKEKLKYFIKFYLKNVIHSFFYSVFLNFEKILFFKLFDVGIMTTYISFNKIINLNYELTHGFIIQKKYTKNFKFKKLYSILIIILTNISIYAAYSVPFLKKIVIKVFGGQLDSYYDYLLSFMIVNLSILGLIKLFYIDMVRKKNLKQISLIILIMYLSFVPIFFLKPSMQVAIIIEIIFLLTSCIACYLFIKNEN